MKKRIPFNLEHREKIESGEYLVYNNYGLPVEIVKWDCNEESPLLGWVDKGKGQESHFYTTDGKCYDDDGEVNDLYILVETYTRSEAMALAKDEALALAANYVKSSRDAAMKFLRDAGIMDENGELAEQYRPDDYDYKKNRNESLRTKIKIHIFDLLGEPFILGKNMANAYLSKVYPSVERAASRILKAFGIKDTSPEIT